MSVDMQFEEYIVDIYNEMVDDLSFDLILHMHMLVKTGKLTVYDIYNVVNQNGKRLI